MAPKTRSNADLLSNIEELQNDLAERDSELAAEKAKSARLESELQQMKDTVANVRLECDRRFSALEKEVARITAQGQTAPASAPPPPYLAAARANSQGAPPRAAPTSASRPPRTVEPQQDTARFVIRAVASTTSNTVQETLADCMGINTSAILLVQKIMPKAASNAAAPSTSAAGAAPAAPTPQATFIITASTYVADKAVKGDLRKQLRERNIPMYVDDYLTREEQLERKRRLPEKQALKAAGTTVAWRKASLWELVKVGDEDIWRLVPAPAAAPAGGAPETAPVAT